MNMCFFKKRKEEKLNKKYREILMNVLARQPRVEKMPIAGGRINETQEPFAKIHELGPAMLQDLGKKGKVRISYNQSQQKLTALLVFSYQKGDDEIDVIKDALDTIDLDHEFFFPGEIYDYQIIYYTDTKLTGISFYTKEVTPKNLEKSAEKLLGNVFDWMDVYSEAYEDAYGICDDDEEE